MNPFVSKNRDTDLENTLDTKGERGGGLDWD